MAMAMAGFSKMRREFGVFGGGFRGFWDLLSGFGLRCWCWCETRPHCSWSYSASRAPARDTNGVLESRVGTRIGISVGRVVCLTSVAGFLGVWTSI